MSIVTWEFESPPLHLFCGNSSVGRAQPCQGWGRGSESRFPLQHSEASVSEAFVVYARFVFLVHIVLLDETFIMWHKYSIAVGKGKLDLFFTV